ncbi:MAG: 2-dehydropantoate 2-reductase [Bacillaceae bacterium]|nr:2-dehydropantoate 2-reductase [Bacillaceae bacterium]
MRIAIIGGGSIGLLLASRMQETGAEVKVVTRTEEQADRIQTKGVTLTDLDGHRSTVRMAAHPFSQPAEVPPADWTIIAVKQTQTEQVIRFLTQWKRHGNIVSIQNGMGHMERLRAGLDSPLYMAVTTEGAYRKDRERVIHAGKGRTWVGRWRDESDDRGQLDQIPDPDLARLLEIFTKAGFEAAQDPQIRHRAWHKLLTNCVINPLTALFDVKNGELIRHPSLMACMKQVFEEGKQVAKREQIKVNDEFWQEIIDVCRSTSQNQSSMLQDIRNGRRTEIDFMNGYLVECGNKHHLDMSTNRLLVSMIHAREEVIQGG